MPQITIPNVLTMESCEFALPQSGQSEPAMVANRGSCKMTARTGKPVNIPGIGPIVHDFAGMRKQGDRLNVDYCHNQSELIGYCEGLHAADGDLACEATIFSVRAGDRASEVLARAKAGQPYQCSIKWDDGQFERVPEGQSTTVNGREFSGPGLVVRTWTLRGVAVCPYGADVATSAEFSANPQHLTLEDVMSEDKTKTPEEIRAELQAQAQDYLARFGGEMGAKWFAEGKPLVDCYGEFTTRIREQHTADVAALTTKHAGELAAEKDRADKALATATELQARIDSLGTSGGAEKAVSGGAAKEGATGTATHTAGEYTSVLSPGLARVAAGIKMPA